MCERTRVAPRLAAAAQAAFGAVAVVAERLHGRGKQSIRSGTVGATDRHSAMERELQVVPGAAEPAECAGFVPKQRRRPARSMCRDCRLTPGAVTFPWWPLPLRRVSGTR
jgi:hypothetical protein